MKDYLHITFTVSIIIHTAIIFLFPYKFHFKNGHDTDEIILQLKTPQKVQSNPVIITTPSDQTQQIPPPFLKNLVNTILTKDETILLNKPKVFDERAKEEILSHLPSAQELKENPAYMDYYELIRERIRETAFKFYHSRDIGKVSLTFIVNNNGHLDGLIPATGSSPSSELISIALKTIENAAPFPKFPQDLANYQKLQFDITIHFKQN